MMAALFKGAPVAAAIDADLKQRIAGLREAGVCPTIAVVRVGDKPDDIAYENSIVRHADKLGMIVRKTTLAPEGLTSDTVIDAIEQLNTDKNVHGILLFRPLPAGLDEDAIVAAIAPEKDIDGVTLASAAGVFLDKPVGYPPCTAAACLAILDHYDVDLTGKKVCVIGRSAVIGRPVAMMLIARHATVTVCHTRTRDLAAETRAADIIVAAAGHIGTLTADMVQDDGTQILIDVGINFNAQGQMVGDITSDACAKAAAYTPVPGGVGAVTTAILCAHAVSAAEKATEA